jgi:dTDP-4-dehydrorhamnose reductase
MGIVQSQESLNEPLLIVGADGLLGGTLRDYWRQAGRRVVGTHLLPMPDNADLIPLNLSEPPDKWPALPKCRAAVLCAAITNLDFCRKDPAATRLVNVTRTLELARRLTDSGAFVVFISSNLVFDGAKPNRSAAEPICPVTEYGKQKAEAEAGLKSFGDRAAIVRLTKVFHPKLQLLQKWSDALKAQQPIEPFNDLLCSPITLSATIQTIARVAEDAQAGIWQLSGTEDISYAGIAQHLARRLGSPASLVRPVSARGSAQLDFLPQHTTLDASRTRDELGFEILEPAVALDRTLPV